MSNLYRFCKTNSNFINHFILLSCIIFTNTKLFLNLWINFYFRNCQAIEVCYGTMSHTTNANSTCDCSPAQSIPFLDTSCSISCKKIHTDLFKKPTDRNQYLLTSSCHPSHVCESIAFSLALRIARMCSTIEAR